MLQNLFVSYYRVEEETDGSLQDVSSEVKDEESFFSLLNISVNFFH